VNFFVGASGIRFRDFFLASLLGRIPGIILLTLVGVQVENILRRADAISLMPLGVTLILMPFALGWLSKRVPMDNQRLKQSSRS
jgi:uncharacterized membrane protein YdjX (TVP38/TMEM64 family)